MAIKTAGPLRKSSMKRTVKDQSGAGKIKIGELLSKAGYITPSQLENAKKILQKSGGRLSAILRQLEYIDENTVYTFLSRQHNYPAVVIKNEPPSKDVLKLLPYEQAKEFLAFPLRMAGNTLQVTMAEPSDAAAVEELQNMVNRALSVCVSTERDIIEAYQKYYGINEEEAKSFIGVTEDVEEELDITQSTISAPLLPRRPMISSLKKTALRKAVNSLPHRMHQLSSWSMVFWSRRFRMGHPIFISNPMKRPCR